MKKLLSLILAVMMVISAFSVTALADGMNSLDLAPVGEAVAPATTGRAAESNNGIFTIKDKNDKEIYPEKLENPGDITTRSGDVCPSSAFDFVDGFWKITVPKGTDVLKFSIDNIRNVKGEENILKHVFFGTWKGGISATFDSGKVKSATFSADGMGPESKCYGKATFVTSWGEDCSEFMYDTEYADGFYTIPLEYLIRDPAKMYTEEKQVWGELDTWYKYAVICIGNFDKDKFMAFDAMILVQIGNAKEPLSSLEIVSPPKKTEYIVGETFDTTGLSVKAKYSNSEEIIQNDKLMISPNGALKEGDTKITISYEGVSVEQPIRVSPGKTIGVDGVFTLTYTAASEGNIEEVGTAARSGGTGKAYVITLPEDTEIKVFAALQESATFSGIGTKSRLKGIPVVEDYIENEKFETQAPQYKLFIYNATTFKSGYQLPVRNVKGFGIYIQDKTVNSYDTIFVQIKVKPDEIGMEGEGTKENPYIIRTSENLKTISEKCNAGESFANTYFKFADDIDSITLPANWTPIGTSKTGFSGNINGNGKTLIVPKNSLSLIGVPKGCTIENLSIYGEKIPGYGLVEGYTTSCTGLIKNITIKSGSHILKSGLIGGYGNESVNIYDCTVEKGVIIGDDGTWGDLGDTTYAYDFVSRNINHQDMIGSFCGAWNGTITNCVSYATVYGRNYVGGIVGFKGQSMRKCFINNCAFYGDIIATGEGVGGIVGSGYLAGSAPNSPCVTIENCYATGSIKGKNKVGGIFGGELGVTNNWGNGIGRVRGNYFSGTVSATGENASVGGVIGFMKSMDIYNDVQGNYFVDDCGAANGIGAVETVFNADKVSYSMYTAYGRDDNPMTSEKVTKKVTRAQVTNGELVKLLNSGKYGRDNWQQGSEYPVFGEGKHIIGITSLNLYDDSVKAPLEGNPAISVPHNNVYESLYEKDILIKYSDGTQEILKASEGKLGGFDLTNTKKTQLATLTYGNYDLTFGAQVYKPATGNIKVSLQVLGDSVHGNNGEVHTLKNGNLTEWFPMTEFDDVPNNYTVWDFLNKKLTAKDIGMKLTNSTGNYISAVEYNGIKLSEGDNGKNSCWQFTINGVNSSLGVAQQDLSDGDVIVLYFTDDYAKENPTANYDEVKAVKELIEAIGTVTKDSGDAIAAARKAYDMLGNAEKSYVDNYDKLVKAEQIYDMIIASNKPAASGKAESTGSVIHIAANGASKGEQNPNTGAPAMSMAPAVLVLAAAALVLKKRG